MADDHVPKRGARLFRSSPNAEIEEELAFHLEQRVRDNVEQGMDPDSARAAAAARLGDLRSVRSDCADLLAQERRAASRRDWLGDVRLDLRFGVRSALRAPLFSLLAIVTLALGIGANAAIFGVVKSVLLDALPYGEPDRLVRVYGWWVDGSFDRFTLSAGSVRDLTDRQTSFEHAGASASGSNDAFYAADDRTEIVQILWVEPGHLQALGVAPRLGRSFVAEDARDTAQVVLLSHATWQQRFGGESDVLGRVVRINELPRTVIGVMPRGFVAPAGAADFYLPLSLEPTLRNPVSARGTHWLNLYGRLRPGVTLAAAQAELAAIGLDLAREHPRDNESIRISAEPLRAALIGATRTPLLMLQASAALVLLIACANLAGALLSRTISRRKEFAVRVSLGAGRGRLVRQLLTESMLLAVLGGAAGIALATLGLGVLRDFAVAALPQHVDVSLDRGATTVAFVIALVTGLVFGIAPALAAARSAPQGTLRDETRGASEGLRARRLRGALVAAQVALCLSLLAGAGLLTRSLWAMATTPHGYDPDGLLAVSLALPAARYGSGEARWPFYEELGERLRALPGVRDVAVANNPPTRLGNRDGFSIEGAPWPEGFQTPFIITAAVSDDYFRTLGIPLREGRTFGPADHADAPPVVVISESMARRYWPYGDAVGARIRTGPDPDAPWMEVIGVVDDVRNDLARATPEPQMYYPVRQGWWAGTLMIRTTGEPLALADLVRRELAAVDAAVPLREAATMNAIIGEALTQHRLPALLMAAFGALALLLAAVGVYAMFATMAAAREREFGVRLALGSSRRAIASLVLRQGAGWMILGLAGGVVGVVVTARLLGSLLFGVTPLDFVALGLAVVALISCATVALLVPVRRATRVDPASVMR
jgi:putative ABC transport system permease protein